MSNCEECKNCKNWIYLWRHGFQNNDVGGCKIFEELTFDNQWCIAYQKL